MSWVVVLVVWLASTRSSSTFDAQISTSSDIKELKSAMANSHRASQHTSPIMAHEFAESTPDAYLVSCAMLTARSSIAKRYDRLTNASFSC